MNENNDNFFATYLLDLIKKEIRKELKKANFMNSYSGKVVGIGEGTLDVVLGGSDETLLALKNKIDTDISIDLNDEVVVVCLKNDLSNAFCAWKK
jgi:hypothetical protein